MNPATITARRAPAASRTEQIAVSQIVKTVNGESQATKNSAPEEIKIGVEFKLKVSGAKSVAVAGNFNGWNARKTPLRKDGDSWVATVELPRGRYEYRFVVDGKWLSDPAAKESVTNPFGESNSVLRL